ncbi:amidohydrolase [Amycolatopsis antarctica]|uniref:Amidohydrolase n=1 Tax=Amycolatopsis antarctica TaxID=1854586 RepID=A0A263D4E1_9PSEU|nr:M20 family metallopeptidase [Amycolatopsis antarctica]OZM73320.1 amidohydrolase [Amycolatopsis antarctica]
MEPTELPSLPDARFAGLLAEAEALQSDTVSLRREIHRQPEQGLRLPVTQAAILRALEGLPLEISLGKSTTSITAILRGAKPGPAVLLRADMDALPLTEESGEEFASEVDGTMHACGHDLHVAMLVSAARLLCEHASELAGSVVFMFQPGEEGYHGARHMIHEGVLDAAGERVERALALHVHANMAAGHVFARPGPILASADQFFVTVTGKGGHASAPHAAIDPIPAAAAMVGALQTMITRRVSVFEPAVLTVARIAAGTTTNIIPEVAELEGTIRTVSERTRALVRAELPKVCEAIGTAHGCKVAADIEPGYPVTVNDDERAPAFTELGGEVLGADRSEVMPDPIMGAEDFSYVLQRIPGTFAFVGACPPGTDPAEAAPNHSNRVRYHEQAMAAGVAMYAAFALDALR